ncbi:putative ABC-2 type transporter [Dioscorea sansibarensis]
MLVGPVMVLFMDEISNGLGSSTSFEIVKFIRQMVRLALETFDLFDDIILPSKGQVVYHNPREKVLDFSSSWVSNVLIRKELLIFFKRQLQNRVRSNIGFPKTGLINISQLIVLTVPHETIADGGKFSDTLFCHLVNMMFNGMAELTMTVDRLTVFYKQGGLLFYPLWAFGLSYWLLKILLSLLEFGLFSLIILLVLPLLQASKRPQGFVSLTVFGFTHQMALSLFLFIAAADSIMVNINTFGMFALLIVYVLDGFITSKDNIQSLSR